MRGLRSFLMAHRALALALLALALAMKALVPAGFMPAAPGQLLTVVICDGTGEAGVKHVALTAPAKQAPASAAKADGACPWGGLNLGAPGGADGLLVGALLRFILGAGLAPLAAPPLARLVHLRPPLRGPPLVAR